MTMPADRSSPRRRRGLLAIVLLTVGYALLIQTQGWAQISNYALVRALADGTAKIDPYHWETRDESYYKGHYYSVKAPGLAFVTTPLYGALDAAGFKRYSRSAAETARNHGAGRWVGGKRPESLYGGSLERTIRVREAVAGSTVMVWALGLLGAVLPAFLLMLLVRAVAERIEPGFGTAAALTLGVGTMVTPFATLFFSHVLSALLVFAAFALLFKERQGASRLLLVAGAGLLSGLAVTSEYPVAIAGVVIGLYAVSRGDLLRRGLAYAGGVIAGVLPVALYNLWAFGSITHFSYENAISSQGRSGHAVLGLNDEGFFGITAPNLHTALKLLFAAKGLLVLSPVLAMAVVGTVLLYRRGRRAEALTIGGIALAFLTYNSGYWLPFGGGSPGPRFLVPVLPFLAVPLAIAYRRFPATTLALAVPSALLSTAATMTLPLIGNDDIGAWAHLVQAGVFEHSVVSILGGDDSWGAIAPVLVAIMAAIALAVAATPRVSIRAERVLPVLALAAWALAATLGLILLSGPEAASDRAFALLGVALGASLVTVAVAAALERRTRPLPSGWQSVDDELASILTRQVETVKRASRRALPGRARGKVRVEDDGIDADRSQPRDGSPVRETR
jgi:hypothetical protein